MPKKTRRVNTPTFDREPKIQGSIHVFRLVNNMCPGKWVHIKVEDMLQSIINIEGEMKNM